MIHLGDITKIDGRTAPVVDVIIGGSPCQDLSMAGKRAGLGGERSGLYMEQIRVVREMRGSDANRGRTGQFIRPRYMVWENVPGAFSCNKGADFATVLEEAVKVVEPEAPPVSVPEKGWPTSGCLHGVDGGWSIAWRVFDAQFWGVSQRRRRIALVCDFGGMSAPEILFVRKGLSGDFEQGKSQRKEAAGYAGNGLGKPVHPGVIGFSAKASAKAGSCGAEVEKAPSLLANRHDAAVVYDCRGNGDGKIATTITGDHQSRQSGGMQELCCDRGMVVRRLTPLECERLQGFPGGWTDIVEWVDSKGKTHKPVDTPRYKAIGNSIALPPWKWVLKRLCAQYERDATMASLFDGIGGFPLLWEQLNGKGSCLWAREIEEFPMAVTKRRFGDG